MILLPFVAAIALAQPAAATPPDIPTSSARVREAVGAALQRGDAAAVAELSDRLAAMGANLSPAGRERIRPMLDAARYQAVTAAMDANASPIARSVPLGAVPAAHRLIEGIAFDPVRRRLFAGSIMDRRLLTGIGESWREVAVANLGGVFGIAIEPRGRRLWIASSPAEPMADAASAFAGLVALDLDTLREVRRVPMPQTRPGDVAVAPDGTLFVSDATSGAVYRCPPGCREAAVLVPPGRLRSPQGMVAVADGVLILADYSLGLMRVDLATGALTPIILPAPMMLEGIDGLIGQGGRLIAIQNGSNPRRIVSIRLDPDNRRVLSVDPIERANPEWGEPTLGTLDGGRLIYVADSQWDRFAPGGTLRGDAPLRPTSIRILPLD